MDDMLRDIAKGWNPEALRGEIRALRTRLQEAEREAQTAVMDGCAGGLDEDGDGCLDGADADCGGIEGDCTTDVDLDGQRDCDDPCLDVDGDGYGVGSECMGPDCDDAEPLAYPGNPEVCDDGIDNDCDTGADCDDPDCFSSSCAEVCDGGSDEDADGCIDGADVDCGGIEGECADGLDDDCDGAPDCADADCFGPGCPEACAMAYEEICELLGIKISERWPAREVAIPVLDEMRDLRVRLQRIRKTAVAALNNRESAHVIEHALTTIRDEAAAALEEPEP